MSTTATPPPASAPSTGAAAPSSPVISLESVMAAPAASASPSTPAPDAPSRASTTKTSAPATEPTTPYSADDLDSLAADSSIEGIAALLMRGGPAQTLDDDPTLATPTDATLAPRDDDDPTRPEAAAAAEALDATADDDDDATDAGDDEEEDEANPAEAELDEEAEPVAEEEAGETLPPAFQKRIDKLTAIKERFKTERDEARQQIDELRAQLDDRPALAPVVLPVSPADPLADLTTEQAVQERLTMAQQVIAWADAHPDGGEITDAQGEPHYFTAQQVAERRLKAQKLAEIDVPKRLAYLRDQRAAVQTAQQIYPDLFVADSFMARQADQFISAIPGITAHPLYPLFVADWVVGAAARAGHYRLVPVSAASPAAPGAPAKPAPVQGSPASTAPATPAASLPPPTPAAASATPPRRPKASTAARDLDDIAASGGGSIDDIAAYFLKQQQAA